MHACAYGLGIVSQTQNSSRSWRDIARELASEPNQDRRRKLMQDLSQSDDSVLARCAICNELCELTSCKTDEDGLPVHEQCYAMRMQKPARGSS
jgi:hypothetical protein